MEAKRNNHISRTSDETRRDLIVKWWRELNQPLIDARVLKLIQERLEEETGEVNSPAFIARILAQDEDAQLRHPEVIESDARWRLARIESNAKAFGNLERLVSGELLTLDLAGQLIKILEEMRRECEQKDDQKRLEELRDVAAESRRLAQSIGRNHSADASLRAEQTEIAEWLKIWLQTPGLFQEWLELRKGTEDFRRKFPRRPSAGGRTQDAGR